MKFISKRKNGTLSAGCNWVSERTHRSQCREVIIPSCAISYLLPTTWSCQTLSTCQWSVIISVSSGWFIIMLLVMFILVSRNITRRQTNSNALFAMISRSIDNWINLSFYFYASLISYFSMLIMKDLGLLNVGWDWLVALPLCSLKTLLLCGILFHGSDCCLLVLM